MCRSAGFTPMSYPGTVQSVRAAADLVVEGRCVVFVPSSVGAVSSGTRWIPLVDPVARYPWSLLWRADDRRAPVRAVRDCARTVSRERGGPTPTMPSFLQCRTFGGSLSSRFRCGRGCCGSTVSLSRCRGGIRGRRS